MYAELRAARGLGARGRLDAANLDILWLPRAAVVASISAIDTYIHEIVIRRMRTKLRKNQISDALAKAMADLLPIKSGESFKNAFEIYRLERNSDALSKMYQDKVMQFQSFQAPDKSLLPLR